MAIFRITPGPSRTKVIFDGVWVRDGVLKCGVECGKEADKRATN